jgi:prominin 1
MVVREYAAGSNHQDARYADMAPKQWEDFPAGGPPQYQRAPTEYERPPPYYYPGAGDNAQ